MRSFQSILSAFLCNWFPLATWKDDHLKSFAEPTANQLLVNQFTPIIPPAVNGTFSEGNFAIARSYDSRGVDGKQEQATFLLH